MEFEFHINTQQQQQPIQLNQNQSQQQINQQIQQLHQSKQITISRSDFNIDEILSLLEEEELKGRKRTFEVLSCSRHECH